MNRLELGLVMALEELLGMVLTTPLGSALQVDGVDK